MENSIEKSGFFCLMMMMIDGSFAGFSKKKKKSSRAVCSFHGLFFFLHMLRLFLLRLVGFQCGHLFFSSSCIALGNLIFDLWLIFGGGSLISSFP